MKDEPVRTKAKPEQLSFFPRVAYQLEELEAEESDEDESALMASGGKHLLHRSAP